MKIASWNINSLNIRLPQVLDWLNTHQPDVLALQETKTADENFPLEAFTEAGWQVSFNGQKTYNGVATVSRTPAQDVLTEIPGLHDPQRRFLACSVDGVRVINLYVVNGQEPGSEKFTYKMKWLDKVREYIEEQLVRCEELVVLGDFNITPEDRDVHDPQLWQGKIHCTDEERDALDAMLALGLQDTFRLLHDEDGYFSWWDYRRGAFPRNHGLRIDLILASEALAERIGAAYIDVEPRRNERPSDHTPVVAEFLD